MTDDPMTPVFWGPFSWWNPPQPPDAETIARLRAAHAYKLGFDDLAALDEAEDNGNEAADGDPTALLAKKYIQRDIVRVAQSRAAAGVSRRSKWDHLMPEALAQIERIRTSRPDLSASRVADLVMDQLAESHDKIPSRSTVISWIKKLDS